MEEQNALIAQLQNEVHEIRQQLSSLINRPELLQNSSSSKTKIPVHVKLATYEQNLINFKQQFYSESEKFEQLFEGIKQKHKEYDGHITNIYNNLQSINYNLDNKIDEVDFNSIKTQLNHFTPLQEFEALQQTVSQCVSFKEMQELEEQIQNLVENSSNLASRQELSNKIDKNLQEFKQILNDYTPLQHMQNENKKLFSVIQEIVVSEKKRKQQYDRLFSNQKKSLLALKTDFDSHPWETAINYIIDKIDQKPDRLEFNRFREEILPKVQEFKAQIEEFHKQLYKFNQNQERFDEIILNKSNKDDIKQIYGKLSSYIQTHTFYQSVTQLDHSINEIKENLNQSLGKYNLIKGDIKTIGTLSEILRREHQDLSDIHLQIQEVREIACSKADKADMLTVLDGLVHKTESQIMTNQLQKLHQQLEQSITIQTIVIKTLLDNRESRQIKSQLRMEAYRSVSQLVQQLGQSVFSLNNYAIASKNILNRSLRVSPRGESLTPINSQRNSSEFPQLLHKKHNRKLSVQSSREKGENHILKLVIQIQFYKACLYFTNYLLGSIKCRLIWKNCFTFSKCFIQQVRN